MRVARMRYRIKGTPYYYSADTAFDSALGSSAGLGRAYDAAGYGARASGWAASGAGPKAALSYSLPTLRDRSRDAVRKNPLAESGIAALESNIVGTGIVPMFDTPDEGVNRELAELFSDWCDEADADGCGSFYSLQALALRSTAEAGEVFGRIRVRRPGDVDTVPLQLQLLEAEFVPTGRDFAAPTGRGRNKIIDGIELSPFGRREAYWMYRTHPSDWTVSDPVDLRAFRVPASEVAHVYSVRRPGQIRGEPWLTRALIKLRDLDAYDDAELMRKKTAALFAGFVTRPDQDQGFMGESEPDEDGLSLATMEPATLQMLESGEDIKFAAPADVGGQYEVFMRQQARLLAVSTGVLYEQLTGDYSQVNDRQFRAAVNEFRRRAKMMQRHLVVYQLCRPIARRFIDLADLSGLVRLPSGMATRDRYRMRWIPQGWDYINPVQEAQADRILVRAGFKARDDVILEKGNDPAKVDEKIAEGNRRADQLELKFDSDARSEGGGMAGAGSGSGIAGGEREDVDESDPATEPDEEVPVNA